MEHNKTYITLSLILNDAFDIIQQKKQITCKIEFNIEFLTQIMHGYCNHHIHNYQKLHELYEIYCNINYSKETNTYRISLREYYKRNLEAAIQGFFKAFNEIYFEENGYFFIEQIDNDVFSKILRHKLFMVICSPLSLNSRTKENKLIYNDDAQRDIIKILQREPLQFKDIADILVELPNKLGKDLLYNIDYLSQLYSLNIISEEGVLDIVQYSPDSYSRKIEELQNSYIKKHRKTKKLA